MIYVKIVFLGWEYLETTTYVIILEIRQYGICQYEF